MSRRRGAATHRQRKTAVGPVQTTLARAAVEVAICTRPFMSSIEPMSSLAPSSVWTHVYSLDMTVVAFAVLPLSSDMSRRTAVVCQYCRRLAGDVPQTRAAAPSLMQAQVPGEHCWMHSCNCTPRQALLVIRHPSLCGVGLHHFIQRPARQFTSPYPTRRLPLLGNGQSLRVPSSCFHPSTSSILDMRPAPVKL